MRKEKNITRAPTDSADSFLLGGNHLCTDRAVIVGSPFH